jgi:hypothetical protein
LLTVDLLPTAGDCCGGSQHCIWIYVCFLDNFYGYDLKKINFKKILLVEFRYVIR